MGSGPISSRPNTDPISNALVVIPSDHAEIHDGKSFTAIYTRTTAATAGHRSGIYLKTPNTSTRIHAVISFAASVASVFSICEAPTIAANVGTHTSVPYNRDRNSSEASVVINNATSPAANKYTTLDETQIAADGTFATGTVIRTAPILAGSGPFASGGSERGEQEYILKANTAYIFLLTNSNATATVHYIYVDWYEE